MNRSSKPDISMLIRYADSLDAKVSQDSREALLGLIDQGEAIGQLINYYSKCQSAFALDLLSRVKEPYDTDLCNRIQDFLVSNPLAALTLLGQVVQKSPSWLPKLADHPLIENILRLIRPSQSTVVVVTVVLFLSSLIPHFARLRKSLLIDLFRALLISSSIVYKLKKFFENGNDDEVGGIYLSHLYCALVQYFVVLYGIYPTNLLEFLRSRFTNGNEIKSFSILESVFCAVKFHPNLLKMSAEQELDISRWSQRETHDFVADCRHIFVRPVAVTFSTNVRGLHSSNKSTTSVISGSTVVSQLNDLNLLFSQNSGSSSSESLIGSLDRWTEDENGSELEPSLASRSSSMAERRATILPSGTSAVHTVGRSAEKTQNIRRSSITQRLNNLIRGRKTRQLTSHRSQCRVPSPYSQKTLNVTKEDHLDTESIEEIFVQEDSNRSENLVGQVEEALDMRESCSTPVSHPLVRSPITFAESGSSIESFPATPATVVAMPCPLQSTKEEKSTISSATLTYSHPSSLTSFKTNNVNDVNFRKIDGSDDKSSGKKKDGCGSSAVGDDSNRFSVASFFKAVNRQRFISECHGIQRGSSAQCNHRDFLHGQIMRSASCPNLAGNFKRCEFIRALHVHFSHGTKSEQRPFSGEQIEEFLDRNFPYLSFLQSLSQSVIDEESLDVELKCEHQRTQKAYMEASADYHTCLKQLCLADCLPAKIYDDMTNIIQGLSFEKQINVLNARLALVNQHLMYERCGRLMHAERNRRLFGRIKQQKSSEEEKISLSMALHESRSEREQLVAALSDLRKQSYLERMKREDVEQLFCEQIKDARNTAEKYLEEMQKLKVEVTKLTETNARFQNEIEFYKRRLEDTEVNLLFSESRLEDINRLKSAMERVHEINQKLKDELLMEKNAASSAKLQLSTIDYDFSQYLSEIAVLQDRLLQEQNLSESMKVKAHEYEEGWMQERQRSRELISMLERAKKVHMQQCEAAQHKYLSLLSICERQQSHILDLNAKIEEFALHLKNSTVGDINSFLPSSSISDEVRHFGSSQQEYGSFFPPELFAEDNDDLTDRQNHATADQYKSSDGSPFNAPNSDQSGSRNEAFSQLSS